MSKQKYAEGDWFAVPLRNGGYALGVIARTDGKGGAIGYFFGPAYSVPPSLDDVIDKNANNAILVSNFGDIGLQRKKWKLIIGRASSWDRNQWPIPPFVRTDAISGKNRKVIYDEDNLNTEKSLVSCSPEEAAILPKDAIAGYGAVEMKLTKLLDPTVGGALQLTDER
jgi:hypothetical protein